MTKHCCSHQHIYILAEIGTSHAGSLEHAFQLIDAAAAAGADGVKFQWVYADEILHPDTGFVPLPGGNISLFETFKKLEVSPSFFASVKEHSHSAGVDFICSPFGIKSLEQLYDLEPDAVKIASPELNHFPLLNRLAQLSCERTALGRQAIPVILSTGVSLLADIEAALGILQSGAGIDSTVGTVCSDRTKLPPLSVLHCVTSYPAPETDYNLHILHSLSAVFGIPCGVSDHSLDPVLVPALSAAYGCTIIEKHITLSRSGSGLDDPVALDPSQFAQMVKAVRLAETAALQSEQAVFSAVCSLTSATPDLCRQIAGNGVKSLAPSEKENYTRTNRSIHFLHFLSAGYTITADDISILRTEKVLLPGLHPSYFDTIIGAVLVRDVTAGKGVEWDDIILKKQ